MKVVFLGDKETALFFELEGIETKVAETEEDIKEEIKKIRRSREYGLVIVTYEVEKKAKEWIDMMRFSKDLPLVIDIPSIKGEEVRFTDLASYITQAIGIKI